MQVDPQRKKGLVVLQVQIVTGLVLLDQGVLQQQRLFFSVGHSKFNVSDPRHQEANLRTSIRTAEIIADPLAQVAPLADIQDCPGIIPHQVDAGRGGKAADCVAKFHEQNCSIVQQKEKGDG